MKFVNFWFHVICILIIATSSISQAAVGQAQTPTENAASGSIAGKKHAAKVSDAAVTESGVSAASASIDERLLHSQNVLLKEFHDSILQTVYWALGFVGTLVAILFTINWYSSYRMYEADKKQITDRLDASEKSMRVLVESGIGAAKSEAAQEVDVRLAGVSREIRGEMQALRDYVANMSAQAVARGDSIVSRLDNQLSDSRTEFVKLLDKHAAELAQFMSATNGAINSIGSSIDNLLERDALRVRQIYGVEATARLIEEQVWEIKKIPNNVVLTQMQGAEAALEAKNDGMVRFFLERLKSKIEKDYAGISTEERKKFLKEIGKNLDKFTKIDEIGVNGIRALIASILNG